VESNPRLWEIDANCYTDENIDLLLKFRGDLAESIGSLDEKSASKNKYISDTLITKIMLGVFGNVPAFDSFFMAGLEVSAFGSKSLQKIAYSYEENKEAIEKYRNGIKTLNFDFGKHTKRHYTRAKILDMALYTEGEERLAASSKNKQI
jgi:hypothetical protein